MNEMIKTACALAACAALGTAFGQEAATAPAAAASDSSTNAQSVVVSAKRANRVSKGATGLPMDVKDTPQTISTIDAEDMKDFGATGSNDALRMGTGINVEQYETNRASYNSRGFDIQLTQLDGLGMTNDWGTVVGQQDTFLFERIELIRGANGLLTGVGNASGTINYVRKRPINTDGGEIDLGGGSWNDVRAAIDYNKVLTSDGSWAARVVATHDDGDSYLRALHDKKTNLYGVVDGQIGEHGVLTFGASYEDARQKSPMWGALSFVRTDSAQADFPVSSSTSQDWTYWNTRTRTAFVEYAHDLGAGWEAKFTYNHHDTDQQTKIFYAYVPTADGALGPDNTGLVGWPYASHDITHNDIFDANVSGKLSAFGRRHEVLVGISRARASSNTDIYPFDDNDIGQPLPAFPYGGDVYPEPDFGPAQRDSQGRQTLTRLYGVTRIAVTDTVKGIVGLNAVQLRRAGSSIYGGGGVLDPKASKVSPYLGATWDVTQDTLAYVSWSDIFQSADQSDVHDNILAPVRGVNLETGIKSDWLDRKLLTTFALYQAQENGLPTHGGMIGDKYWYFAQDTQSRGFEAEATGKLGADANVTLGFAHVTLTGPDGHDAAPWVPRNTAKALFSTRVAALPALRVGVDGRWQSAVQNGAHQGAYTVADVFASWELTSKATLRLNVDNLFDKKYITGVEYGDFYGAPTNGGLSLEYKL